MCCPSLYDAPVDVRGEHGHAPEEEHRRRRTSRPSARTSASPRGSAGRRSSRVCIARMPMRELRHRMGRRRAARRACAATWSGRVSFARQARRRPRRPARRGRHVAGEQEPEHALGEGLRPLRRLGEALLQLRDRHAPVADPLLRIDRGGLRDHALDVAHPAVGLRNGDVARSRCCRGRREGLDVLLEGRRFRRQAGLEGAGHGQDSGRLTPASRRGLLG